MITIDSTNYDVPIINIDRKFDMLYSSAERTEDGTLHSKLIGVYKNYTVSVGKSDYSSTAYDNLIAKLSEAVESHSVTILGNTYSAYFANIHDRLVKDKSSSQYFRELSFDVIAISPAAIP